MRLDDTAEMMSSPDYKECFKAEYYQVAEFRYHNWKPCWIRIRVCWTLSQRPRSTYNMQVKAMTDYIAVLDTGGSNEGIEL